MSEEVDREELVAIFRSESEFWMNVPDGNNPGTFAWYAVSLLSRLSGAIEGRP